MSFGVLLGRGKPFVCNDLFVILLGTVFVLVIQDIGWPTTLAYQGQIAQNIHQVIPQWAARLRTLDSLRH